MVKVAINGFGRIGRVAFRGALERFAEKLEVVAVNTSGSLEIEGWANLLKYDSVYGHFGKEIKILKGKDPEIGVLSIEGKRYPFLAQKEPAKIPWNRFHPDVVLESTGVFRTKKDCLGHLSAGAKKVIISAPAKDATPTFMIGVNADQYNGEEIISNASCTTNCIAPIIKVVKENFKVTRVVMTTIHAYTADQELVDGSRSDLRRARAAACNIIPTSTGASSALISALPDLKGFFSGLAIRVPVACGSLADLNFVFDHNVRAERINRVLEEAAGGEHKGIIQTTSDPVVSSDCIGSSSSAIVDLSLTCVTAGNIVKVVAWYDNECGYACRLLDLAGLIGGYD